MLAVVAEACAARDARRLYPAVETRARRALQDIVNARAAARALIEQSYPPEARAEALEQLGDADRAHTGAELFALRCEADCLAAFCRGVGASRSSHRDGGTLHVKTVRGGEYDLARDPQGRYGLVFQAAALARESARAFAELSVVKTNARVYREQKSLR